MIVQDVGYDSGGPALTPTERWVFTMTVSLALLALPGAGFVMGYFVFSSQSVLPGLIGLGVGGALYLFLTQVLSAICHIVLAQRWSTPDRPVATRAIKSQPSRLRHHPI